MCGILYRVGIVIKYIVIKSYYSKLENIELIMKKSVLRVVFTIVLIKGWYE
jgi:hypothetical protein